MRSCLGWFLVGLLGCGPTAGDVGSATDADGTASASGPDSAGSSTSLTTAETATTTDAGGSADVDSSADDSCPPDDSEDPPNYLDVGAEIECNLFEQDCEPGSKCVPRDHAWVECVAQDPDPLADDEPCEPADETDPCGPTSWCAFSNVAGLDAVCTPLCTGTLRDPICPAGRVCIIDDESIVAECQIACDPFDANACAQGTCQPTARGFGCLQPGVQQAGAQCYEDDSCVGGLVCGPGDEVAGCCAAGCCTPLCSPEHPCHLGACVAFDPPVPGAEGVGRCAMQ